MLMPATLPGVRANAIGRPRPSAKQWILLVNPPRERPMAWIQAPLFRQMPSGVPSREKH